MTEAGAPASTTASTVHRPSPESDTRPLKPGGPPRRPRPRLPALLTTSGFRRRSRSGDRRASSRRMRSEPIRPSPIIPSSIGVSVGMAAQSFQESASLSLRARARWPAECLRTIMLLAADCTDSGGDYSPGPVQVLGPVDLDDGHHHNLESHVHHRAPQFPSVSSLCRCQPGWSWHPRSRSACLIAPVEPYPESGGLGTHSSASRRRAAPAMWAASMPEASRSSAGVPEPGIPRTARWATARSARPAPVRASRTASRGRPRGGGPRRRPAGRRWPRRPR